MELKIDELDSQIISLLQSDGRMQLKDIANRVGVSIPTVRSRISKLIELGVIKKFTAVVAAEKIWGRVRFALLCNINTENIEDIKKKLNGLEEVRCFYFLAGEKNALIVCEVDGLENVSRFTSKLISLEMGIESISSFIITNVIKEEYGSAVGPNTSLSITCDFCGAIIYGKPLVKYIDGGRYYFSAKECAEAYIQKRKKVLEIKKS